MHPRRILVDGARSGLSLFLAEVVVAAGVIVLAVGIAAVVLAIL